MADDAAAVGGRHLLGPTASRRTDSEILAVYEALRAQGCGYHLSSMSWHCRDDASPYPGTDEACAHIQRAIPNWRTEL